VVFINPIITRSTQTKANNVKSVILLEKNTFHVTSIFDKKTHLADLLFAAAGENLFGNPLLPSDFTGTICYNKVED